MLQRILYLKVHCGKFFVAIFGIFERFGLGRKDGVFELHNTEGQRSFLEFLRKKKFRNLVKRKGRKPNSRNLSANSKKIQDFFN